jgi:hypothetical protein
VRSRLLDGQEAKSPTLELGYLLDLLVPLDGIELSTFALRMRWNLYFE